MLDKDQVIESAKNFISKKNCVFLSNSLPKPNGINQKSKKKSRFYLQLVK